MGLDDPQWDWKLIEQYGVVHIRQAIADERWDDALKSVNTLTGSLHSLRAKLKHVIAQAAAEQQP